MVKRQEEVHCDVYGASGTIYVWADGPVIDQIREMPAVLCLEPSVPGAHTAAIDPRYSIDEVAKEIEALAPSPPQPSMFSFLFKVMKAAPPA